MQTKLVIVIYFVLANLIGFASMGIDKKRAINHRWRISEAMLFFFAIIGGSIGSIFGMKLFHHKTRHLSFKLGLPLILIAQLTIAFTIFVLPNFRIM